MINNQERKINAFLFDFYIRDSHTDTHIIMLILLLLWHPSVGHTVQCNAFWGPKTHEFYLFLYNRHVVAVASSSSNSSDENNLFHEFIVTNWNDKLSTGRTHCCGRCDEAKERHKKNARIGGEDLSFSLSHFNDIGMAMQFVSNLFIVFSFFSLLIRFSPSLLFFFLPTFHPKWEENRKKTKSSTAIQVAFQWHFFRPKTNRNLSKKWKK